MEEEKIEFRKASPETVYTAKKQVTAQYYAGKRPKEIHENVRLSLISCEKSSRSTKREE